MEHDINTAIRKGYFQQIRFLSEMGNDLNARDMFGRTPLINCVFISDEAWGVGLARLLLEKGARLSCADNYGRNVLHYAVILNKSGLFKLLLSVPDFDLNAGDTQGNTALHYSVQYARQTMTTDLINTLKRYQMTLDVKNCRGVTPLELAQGNNKLQHFAELLIAASRPSVQDIDGFNVLSSTTEADTKKVTKMIHVSDKRRPQVPSAQSGLRQSETRQRVGHDITVSEFKRNLPKISIDEINYARYHSAPSLRLQHSSSTASSPTRQSSATLFRARTSLATIKSASMNIANNDPRKFLKMTPAEYYSKNSTNTLSDTGEGHYTAFNTRTLPTKSAVNRDDWRSEVGLLLNAYDYHFSSSYRRGVISQQPSSDLQDSTDAPSESNYSSATDGDMIGASGASRFKRYLEAGLGGRRRHSSFRESTPRKGQSTRQQLPAAILRLLKPFGDSAIADSSLLNSPRNGYKSAKNRKENNGISLLKTDSNAETREQNSKYGQDNISITESNTT